MSFYLLLCYDGSCVLPGIQKFSDTSHINSICQLQSLNEIFPFPLLPHCPHSSIKAERINNIKNNIRQHLLQAYYVLVIALSTFCVFYYLTPTSFPISCLGLRNSSDLSREKELLKGGTWPEDSKPSPAYPQEGHLLQPYWPNVVSLVRIPLHTFLHPWTSSVIPVQALTALNLEYS